MTTRRTFLQTTLQTGAAAGVGYWLGNESVLAQSKAANEKLNIAVIGVGGRGADNLNGVQGENIVAVENSDSVHNIVVCTLCSCYPWPVLGVPPVWYKSSEYRARVVRDPRGVLAEFGLDLPDDVEVRIWDSTAEIRYLVIPQRPASSEGLREEALAALVTRDSMVGTGLALTPGAV